MSDRMFQGKVVAVTGAGRGQGRSHAVRFAEAGADVIAIDVCDNIEGLPYGLATRDDLDKTVVAASAHGTRVVACVADVRDAASIRGAIDTAAEELGGLDVAIVNAGIAPAFRQVAEIPDQEWIDALAVNLTGAFYTARAAVPHLRRRGGGSIIFTASVAGVQGMANLGGYVASKHGVVGLMKTMAIELGPENIRVNAVLPTSVATPMLLNQATYDLMRPELDTPGVDDVIGVLSDIQLLPIPYIEAGDVSDAMLFLASDAACRVTGVSFPVDGGALLK